VLQPLWAKPRGGPARATMVAGDELSVQNELSGFHSHFFSAWQLPAMEGRILRVGSAASSLGLALELTPHFIPSRWTRARILGNGESVHLSEMAAEFGDLYRRFLRSSHPLLDRSVNQNPCLHAALTLANLSREPV
jgi:hypothetical protein